MKTFQQATEIVSRRITNKEVEMLSCWEVELRQSPIGERVKIVTANCFVQLLESDDPIVFIYSQLLLAVQIGIAIGIEMEKPSCD